MITELTPEQEDQLEVYRDKWIKLGLCTEPADRPKAEQAIFQMYANAKLNKPRIMWVDSPQQLKIVSMIFDVINKKVD